MKSRCTIAEHDSIKRDHARWSQLEHVGYQQTEDDDGNVCWLELANCSCGSTLALLVMMRDASEVSA